MEHSEACSIQSVAGRAGYLLDAKHPHHGHQQIMKQYPLEATVLPTSRDDDPNDKNHHAPRPAPPRTGRGAVVSSHLADSIRS